MRPPPISNVTLIGCESMSFSSFLNNGLTEAGTEGKAGIRCYKNCMNRQHTKKQSQPSVQLGMFYICIMLFLSYHEVYLRSPSFSISCRYPVRLVLLR